MAILLRKAITPIATVNGPQGASLAIVLDVCCFVSMGGAFQESKFAGVCKFWLHMNIDRNIDRSVTPNWTRGSISASVTQ